MSDELKKIFEDHTPIVIYPMGISRPDILRTIGEGFVYPEGVFFFDVGWNAPDGGTGSDHFVEGKTEGPFQPDVYRKEAGVKRWWRVGKAIIYEIDDTFKKYGIDFYDEAEFNLEFALTNKDKMYPDRKRAKEIADEVMSRKKEE